MLWRYVSASIAVLIAAGVTSSVIAEEPAPGEGAKFYESQVLPILEAHCYSCHGGGDKKVKSGFNLSTREGLIKGGENGPGISLDKPLESGLIKAINYE